MNKSLKILASLLLLALLAIPVAGCKGGSAAESGSKAFQAASPELKTAWDKATAAAKSNDYATAILTFRAMRLAPNLTPDQEKAINDAAKEVDDRMYDAANAGDAKAKAALDELRKASGR
jgi:hypothetical protein